MILIIRRHTPNKTESQHGCARDHALRSTYVSTKREVTRGRLGKGVGQRPVDDMARGLKHRCRGNPRRCCVQLTHVVVIIEARDRFQLISLKSIGNDGYERCSFAAAIVGQGQFELEKQITHEIYVAWHENLP